MTTQTNNQNTTPLFDVIDWETGTLIKFSVTKQDIMNHFETDSWTEALESLESDNCLLEPSTGEWQ